MLATYIGDPEKKNRKTEKDKEYSLSITVQDTMQKHHILLIVEVFDEHGVLIDKIKYYTFKNLAKEWNISLLTIAAEISNDYIKVLGG